MERKLNVLLTGAAGTVGQEVLKNLFLNYHMYHTTVFDQETEHAQSVFKKYKNSIDVVYGNLENKSEISKACFHQDIVIHLAEVISPLADEQPEKAYQTNVIGTKNLIESITLHSPHAFIFFSSSCAVYGNRSKNKFITAADEPMPHQEDHYAQQKMEAEHLITNSTLHWTIFRLSTLMSNRNEKIPNIMFHLPLDSCIEIVTPEDTARAFVKAITKKEALLRQTFNLGGGPSCRMTYREFLTRSFKNFGLGKLDFPAHSFAEKNFHCGYYADGELLENILHFRRDDIEHYFEKQRSAITPIQRISTRLLSAIIKARLLKNSAPYWAYHRKDGNRF